jgi:phosphoglucosamine mutase
MSRQLFGTDGIRGLAGRPPLDEATLERVGASLVLTLRDRGFERPRVVLGRDTRESGPEIRDALVRGITRAGGEAVLAGVIPTPGLALLTRNDDFAAGLMISASHNPWRDNGVKVFSAKGAKLPDEEELEIESRVLSGAGLPDGSPAGAADGDELTHLHDEYVAFLAGSLDEARALKGLKVVLDCAHGAAYRVAPEAFRAAGAEVETLHCEPDGRNINEGCGSLHPEVLAEKVLGAGADLGFAFDGDADRCMGIDRRGRVLDGDFALYYLGTELKRRGRLPGDRVVATVMSNLGLEKALEREGIGMVRAPVGDRYVLAEMLERGHSLGGEQSGHVILLDHAPTGDGTLTALQLAAQARRGEDPAAVLARIPHYPQVLVNVRVREKPLIDQHPILAAAVAEVEEAFRGEGRVVVRYSGTEPLARVMIEGNDDEQVKSWAGRVAEVFRREIGEEG